MVNLRIAQYALSLGLLMLGVAAMIPKPNPSPAWIAARNESSIRPTGQPNQPAETMIAERKTDDRPESDDQPPRMQLAIRPERVDVERPASPMNTSEAAVPMPIDLPPLE